MKLSQFIQGNVKPILAEWESFARTLTPAADVMTATALRDHAEAILLAIAKDIDTPQTKQEQSDKSKDMTVVNQWETAAATHGALRQLVGFNLVQLTAEFRALRASVLKLWMRRLVQVDEITINDMVRFNEAVDQALAESAINFMEQADRARSTFLAILGHDLRSPLDIISLSADYMTTVGTLPEAAVQTAQQIKTSAAVMRATIRDLLEYSGTRLANEIPIRAEAADMAEICLEALREIKTAHPDIAFAFDGQGDLTGRFDQGRLHQVLFNLLNHAAEDGEQRQPIALLARATGRIVTVKVKNYGPTISPVSLQTIFDPLVQKSAESALHSDASASLGLSLFMARQIVLAHGGGILAESNRDEGTVFEFWVPKEPNEGEPISALAATDRKPS